MPRQYNAKPPCPAHPATASLLAASNSASILQVAPSTPPWSKVLRRPVEYAQYTSVTFGHGRRSFKPLITIANALQAKLAQVLMHSGIELAPKT